MRKRTAGSMPPKNPAQTAANLQSEVTAKQPSEDELLTPSQAAELLGLSIGTLSVWRSTERYPLKYIKLGGLIRYRLSDVREFLLNRTKSGVSGSSEGGL